MRQREAKDMNHESSFSNNAHAVQNPTKAIRGMLFYFTVYTDTSRLHNVEIRISTKVGIPVLTTRPYI